MKRIVALLAVLLLLPSLALAEFSESSGVYDPALAQWALQIAELCSTPSMQEGVLKLDGFTKVGEYNFYRKPGDTRHVAAYTVYDKPIDGGTAVIIAVRGTGDGEWPLNLDLMPSGDYSLDYAENFFLAADDILATHADYIDALESPVFLLTGHSRGAAVANILGAKLTDRFGAENVFAYTFATPRTVRGDYPAYDNIFNIINPTDIVTYLPFPQWGFERYGVDLVLPIDEADDALIAEAKAAYAARTDQYGPFSVPEGGSAGTLEIVEKMLALAPSLGSDLAVRHAFAHPGAAAEDEDGMTALEFMAAMVDGGLFDRSGEPSEMLIRLTQAENDFTPLLGSLESMPQATEARASLLSAHMPGIYGAWMTVALK
ncbi:MAG: hypothetical protein IKO07_07615 [Clostridia bacterium]|nr:hypothetical protein [Clostridia bacterium]